MQFSHLLLDQNAHSLQFLVEFALLEPKLSHGLGVHEFHAGHLFPERFVVAEKLVHKVLDQSELPSSQELNFRHPLVLPLLEQDPDDDGGGLAVAHKNLVPDLGVEHLLLSFGVHALPQLRELFVHGLDDLA